MTNAPDRAHGASSAPDRRPTAVSACDASRPHASDGEEDAVTAVRPQVAAPERADVPGPVPRRVRPPRWLDLRLVLGVLLVLGSVLIGARVLSSADATVPVWAAAGDLAAGTVLTGDDLVAVDVRLDDTAGAYLSTGTRPAGRALARSVSRGELVPRAALAGPPSLVQVALPVQAGYVPPGLTRGRLVDVYAVGGPSGSAAGPSAAVGSAGTGTTAATGVTSVVSAAPVQAVSGHGGGVLSTPTTTVQVVVSVPAARAPEVLAAIGGRPLVVVVRDSVDTAAPPSGPTR
jgi:SAF domain